MMLCSIELGRSERIVEETLSAFQSRFLFTGAWFRFAPPDKFTIISG